jgi:acetylornithine deacetylase
VEADVRRHAEAMADPVISFLRDLVAIDSVNPTLVPGAAGEGQAAAAVAAYMGRIGLDVHLQEVAPGRPNVIGVLEGRERGRTLMFCGHLDTVGVEGMDAPFDPVERNGRLYGRGAQDMKSGVAAMIDAARLAQVRGFKRGRIIVAAVVDEEYASIGADALVKAWRADGAVVTEPTDLQIGVGHKGFAWAAIETRGRAAHGSRPIDGRDAILRMGRVLTRLERLDRDLQARVPHPLIGTGSLHASIIDGGRELSSYPDRCSLHVERRTVPGETANTFAAEIDALLTELRQEDSEFDGSFSMTFSRAPYEMPSRHSLTASLAAAAASTGLLVSTTGMSFWTDAAILAGAGIPSLLFGPGGAGLHSVEEYVKLDEVLACRDALAALALEWP